MREQGIGLLLTAWLGAVSTFGVNVAVSGSFSLDTRSPLPKAGSDFTVDTFIPSAQSSQPFLCSTLHMNQQMSGIFICDLRSTAKPSDPFIVDTMPVPVDTDGDGIPNIWEMRYFGGTTAATPSGDGDWDGAGNFAEYIAGTDPKDGQSLFIVQLNGFNVEWETIQNRSYTLQSTSDLLLPFSDVPGQIDLLGTGNKISTPYPSSDFPCGFYQVVIRLY